MVNSSQRNPAEDAKLATNKQIMVTLIHATAVGLSEVLIKYPSEAERTEFIRTYIEKIAFFPDQSGYLYVYDFNGLNIGIPHFKDLEGKNQIDLKDSKGTYIIRELSAVAKNGGGFVEFYRPKPGSTEEHKKLGYAEPIPGTNYFIGTGVYI